MSSEANLTIKKFQGNQVILLLHFSRFPRSFLHKLSRTVLVLRLCFSRC